MLDEPEAIESAADRLWLRLTEPARIEPEKNFASWQEFAAQLQTRTTISLRTLELVTSPIERSALVSHSNTAVAQFQREYAGGGRRSANAG